MGASTIPTSSQPFAASAPLAWAPNLPARTQAAQGSGLEVTQDAWHFFRLALSPGPFGDCVDPERLAPVSGRRRLRANGYFTSSGAHRPGFTSGTCPEAGSVA